MPPVSAATGETYQVRLVGRMEGQETNNILYFQLTGSGDADVELHLIQVLLTCFIDNIMPVVTTQWALEKLVWRQVSPALGLEHVTIPETPQIGQGDINALPSFNSALLSIRTTRPGRRGRGRMFLAGVPEGATTNSEFTVSQAFWLGLISFAACLVANFVHADPGVGTEEWSMMIYSPTIGGKTLPYAAQGFAPVTEINPVKQIATTRSRKVGRGQ